MQSSEAGDETAGDKSRTPTIQCSLIVMLYFCHFHLMREPLNSRCCRLYFAWALLNRTATVAENLHGIVGGRTESDRI